MMESVERAEPVMTYDDDEKVEVWTWKGKTIRVDAGTSDEEVSRILLEACGFKPL